MPDEDLDTMWDLGEARQAQARRVGMLLVTGGAGFIGSNLVAGLNEAGRTDIVVNDALGDKGKWRNLGKRQLADVVPPGELMGWLDGRKLDAILHHQLPPRAEAARLVHRDAHAVHLCLLGRDLLRPRGRFR
jgi:nucleoside-diphosphate-sugar epimerase